MSSKMIPSTGCCEPFDPAPWHEKEITWKNKLFIKDHVMCFLHIPLNMGAKVTKNIVLLEKAGAKQKYQLMLTDQKSAWEADIYIDVTKEVPGANMATLSGTYLTKVFEGPFKETSRWVAEMKDFIASKNKRFTKLYFSYTTCPRCAKVYGKNYVVIFAELDVKNERAKPAA